MSEGAMEESRMSVVITRHKERPSLLEGCLESIASQEDVYLEVLVLDQLEDSQIEALTHRFQSLKRHSFRYLPVKTQSLSRSRNIGIQHSSCRYIAFTEPDCLVHQGWARALLKALQMPQVAIAGGKILPLWQGKVRWWHNTSLVREMAAIIDLGDEYLEVPRVLGGNFSLDRHRVNDPAPFDEKLGRSHGKLLGGEETDLCRRMISLGWKVVYSPDAVVTHIIPPQRMRFRSNLVRAYYGGFSRALRGGIPEVVNTKTCWEDYAAITVFLPSYITGFMAGKTRIMASRLSRRGNNNRRIRFP